MTSFFMGGGAYVQTQAMPRVDEQKIQVIFQEDLEIRRADKLKAYPH